MYLIAKQVAIYYNESGYTCRVHLGNKGGIEYEEDFE
jgi:hypothetical protein